MSYAGTIGVTDNGNASSPYNFTALDFNTLTLRYTFINYQVVKPDSHFVNYPTVATATSQVFDYINS